ncbi:HotDog domain [Phytophthora cactorum]|nr:HotDog domain [Phytophthora cactorum]
MVEADQPITTRRIVRRGLPSCQWRVVAGHQEPPHGPRGLAGCPLSPRHPSFPRVRDQDTGDILGRRLDVHVTPVPGPHDWQTVRGRARAWRHYERPSSVSANKIFAEVSEGEMIETPKEIPDVVKSFLEWDGACNASMREAGQKAELELEARPPSPTPEKLSARIWQEMKRSMNLPRVTGILGNVAQNRRVLLVGSQAVRFRYPIPPFRPYEIRSQLVFADAEWMYILHKFQCPTTGRLYAEGLCRASCKQDDEKVSAAKLYDEVFGGGAEELPKDMPDVVVQLLKWDSSQRIKLEAPTEAARRQDETAMPSALALATGDSNLFKKLLARATSSWNLPV